MAIKIWKDRQGNKLTVGEFFQRWKQGIEGLSELQQIKSQILFTRIVLLGISLGIVYSLIAYRSLWWLTIILIGAFGNTFISFISLRQKRKALQEFDNMIEMQVKGGEQDNVNG